jgi:hypothetical protein
MKITGKRSLSAVILLGIFLLSSPSSARENEIKEFETALAKATLSVENSDYAEAIRLFKQALAIKPGNKEAALGLGIACSRSGNFQDARTSLLKALSLDPADARTRYELGVVMYKLGAADEARDFFTAVAEKTTDDALKSAAKKYLEILAGGKQDTKRFSLGLSLGTQYDTNVILEPDNPVAAAPSRKSDLRGIFTFDGAYRFIQSNTTTADAGYSFYQSIHQRVHDFNLQQHALKLAAVRSLSSTARAGLKYSYTYSLVGGRRFSETHETSPYIAFQLLPKSLTEFHFVYDNNRYYNTSVFPANADQSGADRAAGFVHTLRLGAATTLSVGYDFNVNDADKRYWSYKGNKGSLGMQSILGGYTATLGMSYHDQQYRGIGPADKRHDGIQEYSVGISRIIGKELSLMLNDLYTIRDSNYTTFEYTRNIVGFFVVTRL